MVVVCLVWLLGSFNVSQAAQAIPAQKYVVNGFMLNEMIQDRYFEAPNGMTQLQIQNFLDQRNSILAKPIPLFRLTPSNIPVNTGKTIVPSQLIYKAQREYAVHAAILLTMLQKEQGLLHLKPGAIGPTSRTILFAMGYGALDSGDLLNVSGFDVQISNAARRLHELFITAPNVFPFRMTINAGKTLTVKNMVFQPVIDIANGATYVLFRYTPWAFDGSYLPNLCGGNLLFMQVMKREFSI